MGKEENVRLIRTTGLFETVVDKTDCGQELTVDNSTADNSTVGEPTADKTESTVDIQLFAGVDDRQRKNKWQKKEIMSNA